MREDHAKAIRYALTDPVKLCQRLNLTKGAKRQSRGMLICCPVHGERNPSCSVTVGPDGTVRVRCFACGFSGDAFSLIASVYGLSTRDNFREVLAAGADLAGMVALAADLRDGKPARAPEVKPPPPEPPRDYPPADQVLALWQAGMRVDEDRDASRLLVERRIDPVAASDLDLLRILPVTVKPPSWASYHGRTWVSTGHRMLVRMFGPMGKLRGVRGWRVVDGDSPKRLPPAGCKSTGIVMANRPAWEMLAGRARPRTVVITEGEPDWVTWSTVGSDAVIGLISGSWSEEFARRIPTGADVVIRTHADRAGDKYAAEVATTVEKHCAVWRVS